VNRQLISNALDEWGIEPEIAYDGAEAVMLARHMEFDLVVMDLAMPVLDGVAATRRIRANEVKQASRRAVPIVAHTSLVIGPGSGLLTRVGLNGILPKPSTDHALRSCIERWCPEAVVGASTIDDSNSAASHFGSIAPPVGRTVRPGLATR
jgi:CheY-like chemotaxis protein